MPFWIYLVILLLAALAIPTLWRITQQRVDKWFYRDRYEALKAMELLVKNTQSITNHDMLGTTFVRLIATAVNASYVILLQPDGSSEDFRVASSTLNSKDKFDLCLRSDSALILWLVRSGGLVEVSDLEIIPQLQQVIYREKQELTRIGAYLLVPVITPQGKLSGLLVLGKKHSDQHYTVEDRQLIYTSSAHVSIMLENLRLYDRAIKSRENLENLINSISDRILIMSLDRRIRFMNKSAIETFGDRRDQICWEVLGKQSVCQNCDFNSTSGCTGMASVEGRHYDISVTPSLNPDGSISMVEVLRDMSRRQQFEESLVENYELLKKTLKDAINTMAKIVESRDPYTSGHQQRVTMLAIAIAKEMKLDDNQIENLWMAAIIHDIGKINVSSEILSKPGKLTELEFQMIQVHASAGYEIVLGMDFPGSVALTILQHHERINGSGYPKGLKGEEILVEAKILAVADTVESMASHRPYRPALGIDKALEEISNNRAILYDPGVVDACVSLFNKGFKFE